MEEQSRCFYLDSDYQPASDMLRKCVGDKTSNYRFSCGDDPMRQEMPEDVKETARMNDISIQRGFSYYNVDNHNVNNLKSQYLEIKERIKNEILKENNIVPKKKEE